MLIYILDLLGVFAFAFFGARAGLQQNFSLLGVIVCAFLPALGGGTIRELLLNRPPIYFSDASYILTVLFAVGFAFVAHKKYRVVQIMYVFDAVGMITFALLGAYTAERAGLGFIGCVSFALLTACGGGVLCDILTRQTPHAFKNQLYALSPALLGGLYWVCGGTTASAFAIASLSCLSFTLQLIFTFKITFIYKSRFRHIPRLIKLFSPNS